MTGKPSDLTPTKRLEFTEIAEAGSTLEEDSVVH